MPAGSHLELAFHPAAAVSKRLAELLYVGIEMARRDLGVAGLDGLEQRVVDEDVLVLGLHHVVALRSKTRHVAIDVHRPLVFNAFQHRVDYNERARSADSRASNNQSINLLRP